MSASEQRPKKFLRTSRACDFCHKRSIRCCASATKADSCTNCVDFDITCRYDRPIKRGRGRASTSRGPIALEPQSQPSSNTETAQIAQTTTDATESRTRTRSQSQTAAHELPRPPANAPDPSWRAFASATNPLITSLFKTYFRVVYPIFPFFESHWVFQRLASDAHLADRDLLASIMAACSLAASRMRDGSITGSYDHGPTSVHISPEVFIQAAESCLPLDITHVTTLDALRAYPLLALSAIQGRRIDVMHKYIGIYFAILNIRQWHDESNWPSTWTSTEKEEMRRLYWSMYTLDVFSSIVWNGCVHFQEAHARVQYPSGGTDNVSHQRVSAAAKWIVGWNFTTDLYRVLEHAVSRSRTRYSHFNMLDVTTSTPSAFSSGLNDRVNTLYLALPETFKTIDEMTGDAAKDIYGFQSANIQATLALLRMVLFSVEADSDVDKKCSVASDLLAVFHRIPKSYLRAISAPLVYHLSGIGQILSSVVTSPMSEASYAKVRELLFSMATLLETLESVLQKRAGAAKSLLDQVDRIDQFMATQRRAQLQAQAVPQARTDMNEWASPSVAEEISFRYQLPNDIVGDWSWPLDFDDTSNTFFEWYDNA